MKLLWWGTWIEVPCYDIPSRARLIEVAWSRPLVSLRNVSGRSYEHPRRKFARFLITDGPRNTLRKARSKLAERTIAGDYHVTAVLGADSETGARVVALVCRMPPCAEWLIAHARMVMTVDENLSPAAFAAWTEGLASHADELEALGRQTYLYAGLEPPNRLVEIFEGARDALKEEPPYAGEATSDDVLIAPPEPRSDRSGPSTALWVAESPPTDGMLPVAMLGAGDYARTETIPALRGRRLKLVAVADREPQIAALVARKHGFALATTDPELAIASLPKPGLVIVATAHDSHARLAAAALHAGHHVLVEKPAVITEADLERLSETASRTDGSLQVGYNRRYNKLVRRARSALAAETGPSTITCIVRGVPLEAHHWYHWPNQGTRVTDFCHWIDLAVYLMEGQPEPVTVGVVPGSTGAVPFGEELTIVVGFDDGSLLTIVGTKRGDDERGVQELIDARRGSATVVIDDLWKLDLLKRGRRRRSRTLWRDKGHRAMYKDALDRLEAGEQSGYSMGDVARVSRIQLAAARLLREGRTDGTLGPSIRAPGPVRESPGERSL